MTTPLQSSPDGAIVVGGGEFNYLQTVNEATIRSGYEMPLANPGNMVDVLRMSLEKLPIEALQPFADFLGIVDGIFSTVGQAVASIVDALIVKPVLQTVAAFNAFLTQLFTNPGQLIGNLFAVVMDGISTIGDFLRKLWENLTGTGASGANKTVDNVATAAGGVKTTLGTTTTTADGARDNLQLTLNELYDAFDGTTTPTGTTRSRRDVRGRGSNVRVSARTGENYYYAGANMLINPGFEDTTFPILNQGVGVTADAGTGDLARTGTRSLKLVAAAGYPLSYLASSPTSQVYFPTSPTEKYTVECWVRGKATNTQATAANGIALGITAYDTNKATPQDVAVSFPSGTGAINSQWVKISATLEIPAGKAFFTPYIQLNSAVVTEGHSFYFDDVVVREVTDAKAASAAAVAASGAAAAAQDDVETISDGAYNAWYGSGGSGSTAQMSGTISAIKTAIAGGFTVEVLTTSGTWTRPAPVAQILDFWVICIGGGGGGGKGATGNSSGTSYSGGLGGAGGGYVAQQINPADLGATISYTVGSGGAAGTTTVSPAGTASTFGSLATSVSGSATASISSLFGFFDAVSSAPGDGGRGAASASGSASQNGGSTPLAAGGAGGSASNGSPGGTASLTGQSRAGGGGGGGGQGVSSQVGRSGGAGGFPGGGGGGGAGVNSSLISQTGGAGGVGANGAIVLLYKKATV